MIQATAVLVVEDNPADRRLIREMLSEFGSQRFRIVAAETLAEAENLVRGNGVGAVLLDLGLPDCTGIETFSRLRASAPHLPYVILSGFEDDMMAVESVRLGAQDYLAKRDLTGRMLVKALHYALERAGSEAILREREEHYRTIVDFTGDWEYWLGNERQLIFISPSCERITGYPPEAFYRDGELLERLVHPADRELYYRHCGDAFGRQMKPGYAEQELEYRIVTKGGTVRWLSHLCRAVFGRDGKPRGRRISNRDITERKTAEAERFLLQSAVSESLAELFLFDGAALRCRFANRGALHNLGYTLPTIEGKELAAVFPELKEEKFWLLAAPLVAGKRAEQIFETVLQRVDGNFYPAEVHLQLIQAAGESVYLLTAQDITERLQRSQETVRARDFYLTLFERFPTPIWRSGVDGTCNFVNETWLRFTGLAPEAVLMSGWSWLIHPEDREEYLSFQRLCFEHNQRYESEYRLRHASGEYRWILEIGQPFRDLEGAFAGFLGTAFDITPRKEAERALAISEARFRSLFENMLEGFAYCRVISEAGRPPDYLHLEVNRAFEKLTGLKGVVGRRASEVIPGIQASNRALLEIYAEVAATGVPCRLEEYVVPLGIWLSISVYRSEPGYFITLIDNISERKRVEEEARLLSARLEERVVERTLALADANKELESFSYSVSHDLRAPLRSLDGFSQALLEDYASQLDETAQDYLRRIRSASQRMAALIDDLLQLSRVNRHILHRQEVDLSALVEQILSELRREQSGRVVELEIQTGITAHADPHLIGIALRNLLENALKFTGRVATAHIVFGAQGEGTTRKFFVRDNGAGFDPTYSGRLFTPFQRLHSATEFPGTGIGLATVARVIRRHGGEIGAVSSPGQGALFTFTLPEET